ncbi:MAG TPA: rod shape-determining protein MreC [Streptosporangiaceae bacterium]|nr:rod shape-determining protein MreC [Streptosporangiaceae bacterium]
MHDTRRGQIALAALLALALALAGTDLLGGSAALRAIGGAVFGGAERGVRSVTSPIAGFVERGAGRADPTGREQALERELIRLKARLNSEQLNNRKYGQLAGLLRLPDQGRHRIIAADVIGIGQRYQQAVTLDVGSDKGVRPQQTVLSASGLVGTVTSVSPSTCTVLLATDPAAVAGVRLAGSGQLGWVTGAATSGTGQARLLLHVLGSGSAVAPGQQLVTAASVNNRPYVAGVPVGVVTRVAAGGGLTRTALVRPFTDFSALEVVGVVVAPYVRGGRSHRPAARLNLQGAGG